MSFQSPNNQGPLMAIWSDEEQTFAYPQDNPVLFTALTAGLTAEVSVEYHQGWPTSYHGDEASRSLYFDYALPLTAITSLPFYVELGPQHNFPPYQTQPLGAQARDPTIQNTRGHGNRRTSSVRRKVKPTVKPTCCEKEFGRIQEFKRHRRDVHDSPHNCPFCPFPWTRPDKIKHHIKSCHRDKFTAKLLEEFETLRGKAIVEFLDKYHVYDLEVGTMPNFASLDFPGVPYLV